MLSRMVRSVCLVLTLVLAASCGGEPAASKAPVKITAAAPVDETRRFPMAGREKVEVVPDQLFGKAFLPGGNVASYDKDGKKWQQFVIKAKSPGDTAILLGQFKDAMQNPKFVAHMGGYYGTDGARSYFVFPKGNWLAGVAGLPLQEADTIGRQMAVLLN
jgi:hypothetical protein